MLKEIVIVSFVSCLLKLSISLSLPLQNNFNRFRVSCPANVNAIRQFDSNMRIDEKDVWCAVYRSNNNLPSVDFREEFLGSMKIATTDVPDENIITSPSVSSSPVAIARMRNSDDGNIWFLDSIRCCLNKEKTDSSCDGGSEYTEAIAVCIDSLLLHHLRRTVPLSSSKCCFDGVLRCKGTLTSGPLLDARGFVPVTELDREMTTHVSSLHSAISMYASRGAAFGDSAVAKSPGARDRALQILSLLGQLDPKIEADAATAIQKKQNPDNDDDYDPWSNMKRYL